MADCRFDAHLSTTQRQRVRVDARRVNVPGASVDRDCKTVARARDRRPAARRPPISTSYCIVSREPERSRRAASSRRPRAAPARASRDRRAAGRAGDPASGATATARLRAPPRSPRSPRPPASARRTAGRCAPSAPRPDRWCGSARRRNSGCASSQLKNGTVVLMPVTRYSPSARRMRAMASGRSSAQATSFEIIGS